jgi:hypothetical protein
MTMTESADIVESSEFWINEGTEGDGAVSILNRI